MKRRKNAVYTGQSKHASTGTGNRVLVEAFYRVLAYNLLKPEDEIAIIPPAQVHPTHDAHSQMYIMSDYCLRRILLELLDVFSWDVLIEFFDGNALASTIRSLAPIVDAPTALKTAEIIRDAYPHGAAAFTDHVSPARAAAFATICYARDVGHEAADGAYPSSVGAVGARLVYNALVACIEAGDEAAYNRIIDLTNEMLESL